MPPRTLYEKLWDAHVVETPPDGVPVLYVDRAMLHEVNSPQAFDGLRASGSRVYRPGAFLAMPDHGVPTRRGAPVHDPEVKFQIETLAANCAEFGIAHFGPDHPDFGITPTHVVAPEMGFVWPGLSVVCSDSHAPTYGAFGALGFGIGASDVENVLRTQTLRQRPGRSMRITVEGQLKPGVVAKDLILYIIGQIGTAGGVGHAIEYAGPAVRALPMEGRMTLCNMSIEAGARVGIVAPDAVTFAYLAGRPLAPAGEDWEQAVAHWSTLRSDPDAVFATDLALDAADVAPHVTWGTSPDDVLRIDGRTPAPDDVPDGTARERLIRALDYMGLPAAAPIAGTRIDVAFIGSCTNARLEDLKAAAEILRGRRVADGVHAMVVPGSFRVKAQAEAEGLDRVFTQAGFEWRDAGCSLCNAMNGDILKPLQRCASSSNRNFEDRQGPGGRVHLMSPAMVAAAAVAGRLTDVRALAGS